MTAINVVAQRKHGCVHVAVDAAGYTREHTVTAYGTKLFTIPNLSAVVTNAGNALGTVLLGTRISESFADFDDFVERANSMLPGMVADCGLPTIADVIVAGISAARGPEAYHFRTNDDLPLTATRAEAEASEYWTRRACAIEKLPDVAVMPVPNDQAIPANWEGFDLDAEPEVIIWALRKHLEMQRQMRLPDELGGIGGFAQVATVSADGITQRMLQRWQVDKLGERLKPARIDWTKWHRDNPKPGGTVSRLRRDMAARKDRKLRAVS